MHTQNHTDHSNSDTHRCNFASAGQLHTQRSRQTAGGNYVLHQTDTLNPTRNYIIVARMERALFVCCALNKRTDTQHTVDSSITCIRIEYALCSIRIRSFGRVSSVWAMFGRVNKCSSYYNVSLVCDYANKQAALPIFFRMSCCRQTTQ